VNDTTAVETTAGEIVMVELDEDAREIRFLDDNDDTIRAYGFDTFATVAGPLALDAGVVTLGAPAVAAIKQWANLDAIGTAMRGTR
jgi:hypothetical protein